MLLDKIVLYNIASWKWLHEFSYEKSFTVFSWPTGAWKSFLAVDSILWALYWKGREKFTEIITKGEKEGWIELYFFHNSIDYKVSYWKRKDNVTKKLTNLFEFEFFNSEGVWEKIYNKTPEDVIWISYDVAVKTFVISQGEIESFAKADPSDKYKIFASAFNIDSLYKISDKANDQLKEYKQKIEVINWILWNTDLSEIENKVNYLKESAIIIKKKENDELKLNEVRTKIKAKEDYDNLIKEIWTLKERNKFYQEKIKDEVLVEQNYQEYLSVEKEYNIQKNNKKLFDDLTNSFKNDKDLTQKLLDNIKYKIQSFDKDLENQKSFYSEKVALVNKEIENLLSRIPTGYELKDINEISIRTLIKEKDNLIIEHKGLINANRSKIKDINDTITKWKEMEENKQCPYCSSNLSQDVCDKIINNNLLLIDTLEIKIKECLSNIELLESEKWTFENELKFVDYNKVLIEIESKKKYLLSEKENINNKLKLIKQERDKTLLEKEDIIKKWNEKSIEIKNKFNEISFSPEKFTFCEEKYLSEKYKENLYLELKQYKVIYERNLQDIHIKEELLSINESSITEDLQTLKNNEIILSWNIQTYLMSLWELNQKIDRINSIESLYKDNKDKLESYTKKIKMLDEIVYLYWKKWKPKQIMESIIPLIEKEANELLEPITEGRYIINISLDKTTQSGELSKNNVFDINIIDKGDSRKYATFSWWEKFQINLALRLAISKVIMSLTGNTFEFVVIDEWFWTQDVEESLEKIINTLESISHIFKQFIVISHVPQLKERFYNNIVEIQKESWTSRIVR